jgi:hypothetical protein
MVSGQSCLRPGYELIGNRGYPPGFGTGAVNGQWSYPNLLGVGITDFSRKTFSPENGYEAVVFDGTNEHFNPVYDLPIQ